MAAPGGAAVTARPPPAFRVALVVPLQGTEALYGPSCVLCSRLAAEEIDDEGGVLARPVTLRIVDGGAAPEQVASEVDRLVTTGQVDAVVGWHLSGVRQQLARRIRGRVPYVYTALYEGGEATPGVFAIGETPEIQLCPGLTWMADEIGVRRWFVIGNDYVWPRRSAAVVRRFLRDRDDVDVDDGQFVPLGTPDFGDVLRRIEHSGCDGVLMFLVGRDSVEFNRQFARHGLEDQCARFSTLMDESALRAMGAASARDVFVASGYFESLPTVESLAFGARYVRRFGPAAPVLNAPGESCYEGLRMLAGLVNRTGSADVRQLSATAEHYRHQGPRGAVLVGPARTEQSMYLATADGGDFDILATI